MNNQFATQFLLEDTSELRSTVIDTLQDTGVTDEHLIKIMTDAVMNGVITLEKALQIIQNPHVDEMTGSGAVGGGSTTGGGTTDGASWDPQGPTGNGEQYAAGTRKKKYQEGVKSTCVPIEELEAVLAAFQTERTQKLRDLIAKYKGITEEKYQEGTFEDNEIAIFDGGEDGLTKVYRKADGTFYGVNDEFDFTAKDEQEMLRKLSNFGYRHLSGTLDEDAPRLAGNPSKTTSQGAKNLSAYSSVGFTKAPSAEEAGKKMKSIDVKMLWKEGEREIEVKWSDIEDHTKKLGRKLHGFKPNSSEELYFLDYMKDAFKEGLITSAQSLLTTASNYSEITREDLNESRAYSRFKKETATRSESERMHEAVKMIHKKLEEVSKLLEFTSQMKEELSEANDTLEYKQNTKKVFEKINKKVIEVYSKSKKLG